MGDGSGVSGERGGDGEDDEEGEEEEEEDEEEEEEEDDDVEVPNGLGGDSLEEGDGDHDDEEHGQREEEKEGGGVSDIISAMASSPVVAEKAEQADGEALAASAEKLSQKAELARRRSEERVRAMAFSRALYALEPLDRFPDDVEVRCCLSI